MNFITSLSLFNIAIIVFLVVGATLLQVYARDYKRHQFQTPEKIKSANWWTALIVLVIVAMLSFGYYGYYKYSRVGPGSILLDK